MKQRHAFGNVLKRHMAARGMSVNDAAAITGLGTSTIVSLRNGHRLPLLATAERLADALAAPSIVEYVSRAHLMKCDDCGRSFTHDNVGGKPRRFCSMQCQKNAWNREKRAGARAAWGYAHTRWSSKYKRAQEAIDAMCNECADWEGVCRMAKCPLRSVSPLPLVVEVVA